MPAIESPADLLAGKADLVTPETGLFGTEAPLPEPRPPEAHPSIEELVASDSGQKPAANFAATPED